MSIGSIFQHCKQENVTNLHKQRRGALARQALDFDKKPRRAKTPRVNYENRRLPMTDLFANSEESDTDEIGDSTS